MSADLVAPRATLMQLPKKDEEDYVRAEHMEGHDVLCESYDEIQFLWVFAVDPIAAAKTAMKYLRKNVAGTWRVHRVAAW